MNFVIFLVSFFIGLLVSSFTFLPVFIILFFGIPTTKRLDRLGYLKKDNKIVRNYFISLILLSSIFLGVLWAVYNFFPSVVVGFVFGLGATVFFGLGKIGRNRENISDFVETNKHNFTEHPGKIIETILSGRI